MTGRPRNVSPHLSERQVTAEIEELWKLLDMLEHAADVLETVPAPCARCPWRQADPKELA